jgi:hypothetical protein
MKKRAFLILVSSLVCSLPAQEALGSYANDVFERRALMGLNERPYLNYRTLSDLNWSEADGLRLYGPELFSSYNSAVPYGTNDGALWQGAGLNMSLTGGFRYEVHGFELTLRPQLVFSGNAGFPLVPSYNGYATYGSASYDGKADTYGYYGVGFVDAPQRFGTDPLYDWSWGDSELRYTWNTLTVGFGTQAVWLGPARFNPLLLSNNAPPFPKIDFGLRRQSLVLFGRHLGDVEARAFWGRTTESEYFDSDPDNDHNLFSGLSLGYAPAIVPGLSLGLNRIILTKWDDTDLVGILSLILPLKRDEDISYPGDQRASITASYILPGVGLELYLEWARNDFSPTIDHVFRYPFHTHAYTLGLARIFDLGSGSARQGHVFFEFTNLESSRDYEFIGGATTFYAHGQITQGHTNLGQWLGAGMGTGGNSQTLGYRILHPDGSFTFYFQRVNPDNDYIWYLASGDGSEIEKRIRVDLSLGLEADYRLSETARLKSGAVFTYFYNYDYLRNLPSGQFINIHAFTRLSLSL